MANHPATVYRSLEQWLGAFIDTDRARRMAIRIWKGHVARNGNVPLIRKCSVCSGKEQKLDIKHGKWSPSRPKKSVRDESRITE